MARRARAMLGDAILAEPGAVAWQFHRKGMIIVDKTSGVDEDELMMAALEAGIQGLRINPGNIKYHDKVRLIAREAKARGVPIRIGIAKCLGDRWNGG